MNRQFAIMNAALLALAKVADSALDKQPKLAALAFARLTASEAAQSLTFFATDLGIEVKASHAARVYEDVDICVRPDAIAKLCATFQDIRVDIGMHPEFPRLILEHNESDRSRNRMTVQGIDAAEYPCPMWPARSDCLIITVLDAAHLEELIQALTGKTHARLSIEESRSVLTAHDTVAYSEVIWKQGPACEAPMAFAFEPGELLKLAKMMKAAPLPVKEFDVRIERPEEGEDKGNLLLTSYLEGRNEIEGRIGMDKAPVLDMGADESFGSLEVYAARILALLPKTQNDRKATCITLTGSYGGSIRVTTPTLNGVIDHTDVPAPDSLMPLGLVSTLQDRMFSPTGRSVSLQGPAIVSIAKWLGKNKGGKKAPARVSLTVKRVGGALAVTWTAQNGAELTTRAYLPTPEAAPKITRFSVDSYTPDSFLPDVDYQMTGPGAPFGLKGEDHIGVEVAQDRLFVYRTVAGDKVYIALGTTAPVYHSGYVRKDPDCETSRALYSWLTQKSIPRGGLQFKMDKYSLKRTHILKAIAHLAMTEDNLDWISAPPPVLDMALELPPHFTLNMLRPGALIRYHYIDHTRVGTFQKIRELTTNIGQFEVHTSSGMAVVDWYGRGVSWNNYSDAIEGILSAPETEGIPD